MATDDQYAYYANEFKLTLGKHATEKDTLIMRLYKVEVGIPDSYNMGTAMEIYLNALKLEYTGEKLEKYGKNNKERYFNIVKKNYLDSYIIGKQLKVFMEPFVSTIPKWDHEHYSDSD